MPLEDCHEGVPEVMGRGEGRVGEGRGGRGRERGESRAGGEGLVGTALEKAYG